MAAIHQNRRSRGLMPKIQAKPNAANVVSSEGIGWSSSTTVHRAAAARTLSVTGPGGWAAR